MTPQIAILTPDDVQRIIREAYEAGKAAGHIPGKVWNAKEATSAGFFYAPNVRFKTV